MTGTGIRLLGAVEAEVGGTTVDLGGPRQRRLAAALALRAGHRVGIGEIIDAVWPDGDLPPKPTDTLYTYVHRLRRSLGDQAIVETKEGSYRIVLSDADVDALLFERVVNECAPLEPERRIVELQRALSLWRGPALSGFEHEEWARPYAVRLAELRSLAVDELGQALISVSRCDEALVVLEEAAAQQPLRERTHRLLMTALHLTGRKAEALRVFQAYRRRLATDLGLAPSEAITELERAITTDSLSVEAPTTATPTVNGYEIHELIGEGAFARIFRGVQPSVGRDVAIKQIRAELADRPDFIRRFEFEAQLVAKLEHPHIVPLYDFWREPGSAYLVMRWVRGGSLERRLADGPLAVPEALQIVEQIGSALSAAHQIGVVHRDVKPANILVDDLGNAYLTDFGIAGEPEQTSAREMLLGSPAYAAPEQLLGEPVSAATDVHALATVLHELLTGQVPFGDSPTTEVMRQRQIHEPLPPLEGSVTGAPAGIDAVIATATAKRSDARYPTVDALLTAVRAVAGRRTDDQLSGTARSEPAPNPYRGLRAFDEADAERFYGRRALIAAVVDRLSRRFHASFVALVGASGSGKSSIVRAGVIPAIRNGSTPGSQHWFITSMIPGHDPFQELALALRRITPAGAPVIDAAALGQSPAGLVDVLHASVGESADVLLVIDQFEELFTHAPDAVATQFIEVLRVAVSAPNSTLRLIITLRADFYDRPLRFPGFAELLSDATLAVPPLAPDELEQAITAPAAHVGVGFEPGLVADLIADVSGQPSALPLLQFALTELYEQRVGSTMLLKRYRQMGGIAGAIAARAELIHTRADAAQQSATRRLMLRLVSVDDAAGDTRRRVHRAELGDDDATSAVLDALAAARLLAFDRDAVDRAPTVEVAHEALLGAWPRLQRWLSEDRAGLRIHRQLTAASAAWTNAGCDDGDLLRGLRLAATEDWAARNAGDLNEPERQFLEASVEHRRQDEQREIARQTALRRQNRKLRRIAAIVGVVAILAVLAGLVAIQQRARAAEKAFSAETSRLAAAASQLATTNPRIALLLAVEAYHRDPSFETVGALQRVLSGTGSLLGYIAGGTKYDTVEWLGDDRLVAGNTNGIDVIAADSGDLIQHIAERSVRVVATAPARNLIAAGTTDSVVIVDLATGQRRRISLLSPVQALTFSPRGDVLAAGFKTGDIALIDPANATEIRRYQAHPEQDRKEIGAGSLEIVVLPHLAISDQRGTHSIAFSPDGSQLLTGGFGYARLWELGDIGRGAPRLSGEQVLQREVETDAGRKSVVAQGISAAFSGNAEAPTAVVADRELSWTFSLPSFDIERMSRLPARESFVAVGDLVSPIEIHEGTVFTASFSGALLLTSVDESEGDAGRQEHVHLVGAPLDIAVRADGDEVAVAGTDGIVLLSLRSDGLIARATDPLNAGGETALGRDGSFGAWVSAIEYTAELWRFDEDGSQSVPIRGLDPFFIWLSPDGRRAVAADLERGLVLVDPERGEIIAQLVDDVSRGVLPTFSFDSSLIATIADGDVSLFDAATGSQRWQFSWIEAPEEIGAGTLTTGLFFDVSGGSLYGWRVGKEFIQWDVADGSPRTDRIGGGPTGLLWFSARGDYALSSNVDGLVQLLDPNTLQPLGTEFETTQHGWGNGAAITPDGRYLIATTGGVAQLWDFVARVPVGDVFPGDDTWIASVTGDGRWIATGIDHRIVRWNLDVDQWDEIACNAAGRNLTPAEWRQYGPRDAERGATCGQYPLTLGTVN